MRILRLNTMMCQTSDMNRSIAFYRDVLGLTPSVQTPYWSDFMIGGVRIGLHPIMQGAEKPLGIHLKGWSLGLEVDDLVGLRKALVASDTVIHGDYHDIPGGVVLDFEDPDGNSIEAGQMGVTAAELRSRG